MSLKSGFLTLSMREQICFAILILNFFSLMVILCVACSFCYEILIEDYNKKKRYFFDKFKEHIEISFYFQNFCLLQYEEIIKRVQIQMYKYHRNSSIYNFTSNYNQANIRKYTPFFNSTIHKNISENNELLFVFCYNKNQTICTKGQEAVLYSYYSLSSLIFSHDISKSFAIPGYGIPILESPLIIDTFNEIMVSFNGTKIYQQILERNSNYIDYNNVMRDDYNKGDLTEYYRANTRDMWRNIVNMLTYYINGLALFSFEKMFEKTNREISELEETKINVPNNINLTIFYIAREITGYYSSTKFPINKFSFISYISRGFFYIESSLINNYLYFLHNRLTSYLDISFIPLHYENNTIISPELCISFLLKHYNY